MSAVGMVAAFSVAMDEHGIPQEQSDKIIDTALRIAIEREDKAMAALREARAAELGLLS